jgi:hypothetical protein
VKFQEQLTSFFGSVAHGSPEIKAPGISGNERLGKEQQAAAPASPVSRNILYFLKCLRRIKENGAFLDYTDLYSHMRALAYHFSQPNSKVKEK